MKEELNLLRDFAYNIDKDGLETHFHKFIENKEEIEERSKSHMALSLLQKLKDKLNSKELQLTCENAMFEVRELLSSIQKGQQNEGYLLQLVDELYHKIHVILDLRGF